MTKSGRPPSTSDVELGFAVVEELVVYLDAPALGVGHHQPGAAAIERDCGGQGEAPLGFECVRAAARFVHVRVRADVRYLPLGQLLRVSDERRDVFPVGGVCLDPVVGPVADVYVSVRIYGDVRGVIEFEVAGAVAAKLEDEPAVGIEFLNAVIQVVCDVDTAVSVGSYAPRRPELARSRSDAAPLGQVATLASELLDPVVEGVDDQ